MIDTQPRASVLRRLTLIAEKVFCQWDQIVPVDVGRALRAGDVCHALFRIPFLPLLPTESRRLLCSISRLSP